jgi:hypothetical protein
VNIATKGEMICQTNHTTMERPTSRDICRKEVAELAYLNWKHDGCPKGKDVNYWLEAEAQLRATRHLLADECPPATQTDGKSRPEKNKSKTGRGASLNA